MVSLGIRRLGYALGAEVTGVDLTGPIEAATVATIRQALLENIVLVLPGQDLEADQLRAFCSQFGELDDLRGSVNRDPKNPGVMIIASRPVVVDGKPTAGYGRANFWHSDFSYSERPTTITFLNAKELPDVGGDTMFANQYMAYETLSPVLRSILDDLSAVHDVRLGPGYRASGPEQRAKIARENPPVVHPLIKTHPETGRKALYIGDRVRNFVGMTEEETKPLLDFLKAHATRYEALYRHRWTKGDLLMWDNRCALHYAVQDFEGVQLRRMQRCSLLGAKVGRIYAEAEAGLVPA